MGSHSLLQGTFPTQGSNPSLPHCRQILYELSHQGSPRILEWVAYPFSRGSSQPRNQTGVSCIVGGFFTSWIPREAKQTYIDKWNRIESTDINPHINNQLICDKGVKKSQSGRNNLFNKWRCDKWIVTGKRLKLDSRLATIKIYFKWIKGLNIRLWIIKLLEEYIRKTPWQWSWLWLFVCYNKSISNKTKNQQVGLFQAKSFCTAKEKIKNWKDILQNGRKYL